MRATLGQLLPALPGATLVGPAATAFDGVSTDSRNVAPGVLFVALRGETFDAHDFLADVAASGAVCVLVERLPAGCTLPAIVVPDTLAALGQIANLWRRRFALPLIGVTGSNGKTTVKEMLAAILAAAHGEEGRLATRGNLNNEIGVPLTLLRLAPAQRAAVVELGMNHPGEIARLAAIAAPTLALVNNAQREHQEFMHTVEAVARENGAVLAALPADGVAVFPDDDAFSDLWRDMAGARPCITFGLARSADVSCSWRADDDFGSDLFISVRQADGDPLQFHVALAAAGEHNVRNALAATACAIGAGIAPEAIKRGLQAFAPVNGRLQKKIAANGATIIDDTYNANPDSVRAAIDVLAACGAPRMLVLGDMGEVGDQGESFHKEIGNYAVTKGIEHVLATGALACHLGAGAEHFEQFDALLAALDARLAGNPHASVLIKGSRFMRMERVVRHLIEPNNNKNKDMH
jgi:UDP-N-acetylmuramoyl-tripeptide--D-alanyl-D-alanine ligase